MFLFTQCCVNDAPISISGLDSTVLKALYDLLEEKASRMYTWKGSTATKNSDLAEKYVTVWYNYQLIVYHLQILSGHMHNP